MEFKKKRFAFFYDWTQMKFDKQTILVQVPDVVVNELFTSR